MDITAFKVRYPELSKSGDALIQACLDEAALSVDASVWGPKYDAGQGALAAYKLALSPYGQAARLVAKDGTSTYEKQWKNLVRQVSSGFRVC